MSNASEKQPDPTKGEKKILDLVLADINERAETGKSKYGTYLKTNNGRDALWDAYQEAVDLVMYIRQKIEEDKQFRAALAEREEWKREVEDACIVSWSPITTPRETIQKLISWNIEMALDPKISEKPAKWVARIEELELELAEREKRIADAKELVQKWRKSADEMEIPMYDYDAMATERTLCDCAEELAKVLTGTHDTESE